MSGLVCYPLQLRPEVFVRLYLPSDLTAADVARLIAFLRTLEPEPVEKE